MTEILIHKIKKIKWDIKPVIVNWLNTSEFLKNKMDNFPHFGGDIETFLLNIKIVHGRRVFGKCASLHKDITEKDIING